MNRRRAWLPLVCLLAIVQVLLAVAQTAADNALVPREILFGNPERTSVTAGFTMRTAAT
jgi:hypothetical protein